MALFPRSCLLLLSVVLASQAQFLQPQPSNGLSTSPWSGNAQPRGIRISEIKFEGLHKIDEEIARQRLTIKTGVDYTNSAFLDQVRSSVESLNSSSYFSDVRIEKDEVGGSTILYVILKEKYTLGKVAVDGNHKEDSTAIWEGIDLHHGQVYSPADLERVRQKILKKYRSDGYLMAQVETQENEVDEQEYDVTFKISEGNKVVVTDIDLVGNQKVDYDFLVGGLASKIDQWYSSGDFKEENVEADKDSLVEHMKEKGYLDSRVLDSKVEYLPDSSYHFYMGSTARERDKLPELISAINTDLASGGQPLAKVLGSSQEQFSPFRRHFANSESVVSPIVHFENESDLVEEFNRMLDSRKSRESYIAQIIPSRVWKDSSLQRLSNTGISDLDESQQRKLVRLSLEELYPLQKHSEQMMTDRVRLHYTVQEGRRYYYGKTYFEGNEVYNTFQLDAQMQLDSGKVFDYKQYKASMMNIYNLYKEQGYIFLNVDDQKNIKDSVVDVAFKIVEGKPAHIRRVNITGNTTTNDKVIRREIKLFPGDIYAQSLMERSFRDIMQLNYFDNVKPDMKVVGDQDVDLVFDVQEKKAGTGTFSAGLSYNENDGPVGNLSVSIPNFELIPFGIGGGQAVNASVSYGPYQKSTSFGFSEPWFMDRPTSLGMNVSWSDYKDQTGYYAEQTRYGGSVFMGRRLTWPDDYFTIQGSLSWYWNDQAGTNYGLIRPTGTEGAVGLTITRDDKNLPMFPTDGSRYSLSVSKIGGFKFSDLDLRVGDFDYYRAESIIKWWLPIFSNLTLGLENDLGVLDGSLIQSNQLFRMGGTMGYSGKLRGYSPGSIGENVLGRSYFNATAEFSLGIVPGTFYLLPFFFDAGNVYGQSIVAAVKGQDGLPSPWREVDLSNTLKDAGAGFRVVVPMMGILGFDFAWPLNAPAGTSGGMQTNFVITQGF